MVLWLFSQNVVVVMTALADGKLAKALRRHGVKEIAVEGLDMWDKAEVVRANLGTHRKTLDESPFNNQVCCLRIFEYDLASLSEETLL